MDQSIEKLPQIISENLAPQIVKDIDGVPSFVIVPRGMDVESLKQIREENDLVPRYRADRTETNDLASFCSHVGRYISEDTVIFSSAPRVDVSSVTYDMTAIIDYHPKGSDLTSAGACKHRIGFAAHLHARTKNWLSKNGSYMKHGDFSAFIEDNLSDIAYLGDDYVPPFGRAVATPADILTLSRGLEVRVNQKVGNATRLPSGETSLVFEKQHTKHDGSELIVPEWFGVKIPVFVGSEPLLMPMRLRYRIKEENIEFAYLFFDFQRTLEDAVDNAISFVRKELPDVHLVEGCI